MAGVTSTGFTKKTLEEIKAELEADLRSEINAALDLNPKAPMGQIVGIVASKLSELWELLEILYHAFDPSAAETFLLDFLCQISGIKRLKAKKSITTTATVNLNAGSTLAAGAICYVTGTTSNRWVLRDSVTNSGGVAADVVAVWESETTGNWAWNASVAGVIVTPSSGWNSVTNNPVPDVGAVDATRGNAVETDSALRLRRTAALAASGACTADAIRAALLAMTGMAQAFVFENVTNTTNSDGVPAHAFEAVIFDGVTPACANNDVAETIWDNKPAGIQAYGQSSGTTSDSLGVTQTVKFSRATGKRTVLNVTIVTDLTKGWDATNGPANVKTALATYAVDHFGLGDDVIAMAIRSAVFSVAGVTNCTLFELKFFGGVFGTADLTIGSREIASVGTPDMTLTVT